MRCSICCLSSCFLWRFRRCHRHRPFRRALGRPCAAPPYKGHAVLPSLSSGVPSAIQGAVFCFANLFVQASVNAFGPTAIAGSTIALNLEYFTYYCTTAFGQTVTTFISQNHAAGQLARCKKILRLCLRPHRPVSRRFLQPVYFRSACCSKRLRPYSAYPVFLSPSATYTKSLPGLCAAPGTLCSPPPL